MLFGVENPVNGNEYTLQSYDPGSDDWIDEETKTDAPGPSTLWFDDFEMEGTYRLVDEDGTSIGSEIDVNENPLPAAFEVTGGGEYCNYGSLAYFNFFLSNSESGVTYTITTPLMQVRIVIRQWRTSLPWKSQPGWHI